MPTPQLRITNYALRIKIAWNGGTAGAGAIDYKIVKIGENLILILTMVEKCDIMDLRSDSADVEVKGFFRSALDVT